MIVENLQNLHSDTEMAKITTEQNSLTVRLREQLLDATNLAKGTLFDNIVEINNKMINKLKIRVDLRTPSAMAEDAAPKIYNNEDERKKGFEEKCQQYIE